MDHATPAPLDEMVDGRGRVRKHWGPVLEALLGLGHEVVGERGRRLQGEDEVPLPFRLDPVPLPLPAEEAAVLEAGLGQRARLLDAVLADLYGPQRCVAEGWVAPEAVFANPGYLRPCRGMGEGMALQCYAADLVRGADGAWRVVADLTGGAPGIGYARDCRRMLARGLPELFRTTQVRQLRPFFDAWQDALVRLGGASGGAPLVAVLTQGAADPHWQEHLSLSRDLDAALAEARDLTVRGGALAIKTLGGLRRVDVLLRRVPGGTLDPLELAMGGPGVTGLLDAARRGAVRVLNHPGAAAVEHPALAGALPGLCRALLGETPLLEAAAGAPSVAPCFGAERLEAQGVMLRLFLMHDGAGWRMMQGGLARVLGEGVATGAELPPGAVLKDVWVLNEEGGLIQGPAPARVGPLAVRGSAGTLPSRVADDFYWLGRYVERLDGQARLAQMGLARRARGAPLPRELVELEVLRRCLASASLAVDADAVGFDGVLRSALGPGGTMAELLLQVGRLIEALRDRLTVEMHGAFSHALREARAEGQAALAGGLDGLGRAMAGLQRLATAVAGVAAEGMVRGGGRLFLDLGRRVERAATGGFVLGTVLGQKPERLDAMLRLALEACDSAITYRSRYLSVVQAAPVLDLVLADEGNPRSLLHQFAGAAGLLEEAGDAELAGLARRWAGRLEALAAEARWREEPGEATLALADTLIGIGNGAADLSERITRRFFALLPKPQSVGLETA